MNNYIGLFLTGLFALMVLTATGATPLDRLGTDDIPNTDLRLDSTNSPNGDYAVINEKDELELLLTGTNPYIESGGVNDNSLISIDRIFRVTYTGDQTAEVWISSGVEGMHFYEGTNPSNRVDHRNQSVVLMPNESLEVGLLADTRESHAEDSLDSFTVSVQQPNPDEGQLAEYADSENSTPLPETPTETTSWTDTDNPTPTNTEYVAEGAALPPGDREVPTWAGPDASGRDTNSVWNPLSSMLSIVTGLFVSILLIILGIRRKSK